MSFDGTSKFQHYGEALNAHRNQAILTGNAATASLQSSKGRKGWQPKKHRNVRKGRRR